MGRWPRLLAPPTKPNQWGNEKCYPYNINHHFELFFPQKVVLKFGCILLYHSKLLIVGCHSFGFFHHFEQFLVWLTEFYFSDIVFFFQNWISASISKPVINQTAAFLIESFLSLSLPLCLSLSLSLLILNYFYKFFFLCVILLLECGSFRLKDLHPSWRDIIDFYIECTICKSLDCLNNSKKRWITNA